LSAAYEALLAEKSHLAEQHDLQQAETESLRSEVEELRLANVDLA